MMAAKSCGARSVQDIGERVGLDDAEFDEKVVSRPQGNLVIFLVGIEIKEGVSGVFELHEITTIALFAVAFGKALGEFEGDHAIGLGMEDEAGRESLLRKSIRGAVKFAILRGGEAIVANPFPRGVADGAEENHCAWLGRRSVGVIVGVKGRAKNGIAPGAGADCDNPAGINPHVGGMPFEKRERLLGVGNRFLGRAVEESLCPILHGYGDHPA